jgi:SnoaL-like domain
MPSRDVVEQFIARVKIGDHADAVASWYTEDAWMRENTGARRVGRDVLVAHEAAALARVERVETELVEPPFIEGDRVAIRWRFTLVPKAGSDQPSRTMEEVAWQTWRGDKIASETFFYDPKQLGR